MAVCSFLCFCRLFSTAEAAVYMFSMKRCPPGIWPSHKRYGDHRGAQVRRHRGQAVAVGAGRRQGFTRVCGPRAQSGQPRLFPAGAPEQRGRASAQGLGADLLAHEATCSLAMGQPLGATSAHVARWLHSAEEVAFGSCVAAPPLPCVLRVRVRETQLLGCLC